MRLGLEWRKTVYTLKGAVTEIRLKNATLADDLLAIHAEMLAEEEKSERR